MATVIFMLHVWFLLVILGIDETDINRILNWSNIISVNFIEFDWFILT